MSDDIGEEQPSKYRVPHTSRIRNRTYRPMLHSKEDLLVETSSLQNTPLTIGSEKESDLF